jgi:hypothetical protein
MYLGNPDQVRPVRKLAYLQQVLLKLAFFNFFLVSVLGLLIRSFPFIDSFPLQYKNLLHGHSHFAFGGWVLPVLIWMIMQYFPALAKRVSYKHWRNIIFISIFSAYGMLASFPFEGYGVVSIIFSTLSVIAGYYLAVVLWKASNTEKEKTSVRFLRAGLIYQVLSSVGPFATGPLVAMGKQGSPIYFDAIYFYLHFQYNGWFTFAVLAVLYQIMWKNETRKNGNKAFLLFNIGCLPAYFLSTLWNHPAPIFYMVGGAAALLQVIAVYYLIKDFRRPENISPFLKSIILLVLSAFIVKNVLQLLSAVPFIADMAYGNRNFIIAYLHLVLLGFVSMFAIASVINAHKKVMNKQFKNALSLFIGAFIITELLMVLQALGTVLNFTLPEFLSLILGATWILPISIFGMYWRVNRYFTVRPSTIAVTQSIHKKLNA